MSDLEPEENIEKMDINKKDILLVRMDDRYSAEQVTKIVQDVAQRVNQDEEQFTTPVLFIDKSVELETVSIDKLENILRHAKSISETGQDAQEEIEFENEEMEGVKVNNTEDKMDIDMDQIPEELEDLIPNELRE